MKPYNLGQQPGQKEALIMRKWPGKLGYKIQYFMQGRYGYDELFRFLSVSALVLLLLSFIPYLRILYFLGIALLIWAWFRSLSKNLYKRQMERQKYLAIKNKVSQKFLLYRNRWRDRKTHKYYKCPYCRIFVRITKPGKGKTIKIHCPKCGQEFSKRT